MQNIKNGSRNYCLDFIKGIACLCVIFMHCEFPRYLGTFMQCVSRFSVPLFFMVSGFFCYKEDAVVDYKKKIRHIGFIILEASVLYGILALISGGWYLPPLRELRNWILFNQPVIISGSMWFLFALLYDYILFAVIEKLGWYRLSKLAIPIGIAAYILLAQGAHLLGFGVPNMIYRNFLIEGFPLFSLGYWLHRDKINISNRVLLVGIVLTTLLCPLERLLLGRDFGVNIVTFPQVVMIFLYCLNNPEKGKRSWLMELGLKYSLYVYVFHPAVWNVLEKLYRIVHISENLPARYMMPILCVAITIFASVVFVYATKKVTERIRKA